MRASKKTAQGLSGAHAYSRLPFVSPSSPLCGVMLASQSNAGNGIKSTSFSVICTLRRSAHQANPGWWCFSLSTAGTRGSRRRCHGGPSHRIRGPNSVTRCVSSWVFLGEVHHERTKQTLARVRPGSTGGSARGYERSRVPRPEHLNPWQAGRNYSITSSVRASNAHGTVPCDAKFGVQNGAFCWLFGNLLSGAAAAWPLAARAQQADRMRRLVVLRSADVGDAKGKAQFFAFMEELAALGWANRFNLRMEIRWGGGNVNRASVFAK